MSDKKAARGRALAALLAGMPVFNLGPFRPRPDPVPKKCLLRECELMTTHKGGYCCAEHCLEDRRREKAKKPHKE